ncbi:MAG: glutamyl-tRNA reductase [Deferribacteres bacterium]|nr:glutamyl-tRNA reductase [Deferribacteres bacterium]
MDIFVVGLNHKTSPVEIREKLAIQPEEIETYFPNLLGAKVRELAALSTCNRVEFYFWGEEDGVDEIVSFVCELKGVSSDELKKYLYVYKGEEAVVHVFRVASSLDSMVLGEPQIVGQFKDAFELSQKANLTGPFINQLMSKALSTSKKVRTRTGIGESAVSVSYAAVELAEKIFGELNKCVCALIGAGEMAELAARHLKDAGIKKLLVVNRTFERAVELAKELGAYPMSFDEFDDALLESDIVITSTASQSFILDKPKMEKIMKKRKHRPIFLIDIAVPRDIDPQVDEVENVYLYNIDDLEAVVEENRRRREKEAVKAEAIVREEAKKFVSWLKTQEVVPLIVALRERAEAIRQAELKKTLSKLNLSDKELKAIEAMSSSIVNKLLHPVLSYVKKNSVSGDTKRIAPIIKEMFSLEDKDEDKDRNQRK